MYWPTWREVGEFAIECACGEEGLFSYSSPKYVRIPLPRLAIFYRTCQFAIVVVLLVSMARNNEWVRAAGLPSPAPPARSTLRLLRAQLMKVETMGSVNMWASQGNISGALPRYCGNESYAFTYDANFDYATPVCTDLPLSAVVDKATQQLFIASSILMTRTRQLRCDAPEAVDARAACTATTGRSDAAEWTVMAGGERCRCTTVSTVTPLIDELDVLLDHDFEASIGPEMRIYGAASNTSGGSQYFTGSYVPDGRGGQRFYAPGQPIAKTLREWLTLANVSLDALNQIAAPDLLRPSVRPYWRTTGVLVRFKVEYTNDRPNATIIFDTLNALDRGGFHGEVLANVSLEVAQGRAWSGMGYSPPVYVSGGPLDETFEVVEQYRQGVVFELHPKGVVYVFDFYTLVLVLVSGAVMLQLAKIVADMVAFYLLFDGRYSDYLRTKRKEVATLEHERAEVAEAATLALVALKALDEIGDGTMEVSEMMALFARTDLTAEEAHAFAHLVCDTAPDSKHGGSYGISFTSLLQRFQDSKGRKVDFLRRFILSRAEKLPDREAMRKVYEREKSKVERARALHEQGLHGVWAAKKAAATLHARFGSSHAHPAPAHVADAPPAPRQKLLRQLSGAAFLAAGKGASPAKGATPARGKTFSGLLDAARSASSRTSAACPRRASASAAERTVLVSNEAGGDAAAPAADAAAEGSAAPKGTELTVYRRSRTNGPAGRKSRVTREESTSNWAAGAESSGKSGESPRTDASSPPALPQNAALPASFGEASGEPSSSGRRRRKHTRKRLEDKSGTAAGALSGDERSSGARAEPTLEARDAAARWLSDQLEDDSSEKGRPSREPPSGSRRKSRHHTAPTPEGVSTSEA